jgi:hypothetical protein
MMKENTATIPVPIPLTKIIFGEEYPMLYKAEYCSRRVALPSHFPSQQRIGDPSLMEKDP